jgi:hypothetical protein
VLPRRGRLIRRFAYRPSALSDRCSLSGGFRGVSRAGAGGSARLFPPRAIIHGGEAAPAARRGEEAAAGDGRRRGVRPVDGVALQAAHHLGAPRRRLPSHVSKRPRILLLLLLAPARTGRGRALSGFACCYRVRTTPFDWRLQFLRLRKGLSVPGQVQELQGYHQVLSTVSELRRGHGHALLLFSILCFSLKI